MKLNVPEELTVDTVQSPQMKEYNVDDATNQLTITLRERTMGNVQVVVRSHRDLAEAGELSLPFIEPLGVERETGTILVFAREAIEVITNQDGLEGAQPLPAGQQREGNALLNSAWSFSRRPLVIPVRTKRKPTRLSAQIGTSIDIQPELTSVETQLDYVIEYSGIDTFRFEVPEEVSESINIDVAQGDRGSAPIKQRSPGEAVDGWVPWTVITQRDVMGRQRFLITYDVPNQNVEEGENDNAEPLPHDVQLIRPLGMVDDEGNATTDLSNVQGEVVVKKERSLSISASAKGGDVEVIDLRELKRLPQSGTLAYRYFNATAENRPVITITQSRHDIQEVVSTVVSRGLVEVVTGEDSEATYRCRFHTKTTERQRLLVHLPVNLEVLGTFLNEREVKLEKAEIPDSERFDENLTPFWVNVARPESSDQAFFADISVPLESGIRL